MSILNRYILKKFIRPFLASFAALCILIFVSQLFDRLDRFLVEGVSLKHVIGYLLTSLPSQALQILPVACLLATLFVVGQLARTREYIAGLAGGLPPEKFLSGLILAGVAISFIALMASETVVPPTTRYARTVFREKIRKLGSWQPATVTDVFVAGAENRMWSAKRLNLTNGTMERVIIDVLTDQGLVGPQVDAESAVWTQDGWEFNQGVVREFDPNGLAITKITPFEKQKFGWTERPSDFVITEPEADEMNYKTLKDHIRRLSDLGIPVRSLEVDLMMKLSFPFTCFVVTVLGIPLALRGRGNAAIGIAAGGILTLIYMGFVQFGKALAQRVLVPWLGAWLGNFVFLIMTIILWIRMRRAV